MSEPHGVVETRKCTTVGCDHAFTITAKEREFWLGRGFDLPKRCKGCRDARRLEREGRLPATHPGTWSTDVWAKPPVSR